MVVKTIKKTLETMVANEEFMNAIREDIEAAQNQDGY
jgi:hypothetical protein